MAIDLDKLIATVEEVENALLLEFNKLKEVADNKLYSMVSLPEGVRLAFMRNVKRMNAYLIASMKKDQLSLVDDRHEELRIRILLIERLIDQDIPYAYLERALGELVAQAYSKTSIHISTDYDEVSEDNLTIWAKIWNFILGVFGIGVVSSHISTLDKDEKKDKSNDYSAIGEGFRDQLKRLLLLVKLIELDQLNLLPDQKSGAVVTPAMMGQGTLAKFFWIDLGETFYGEYLASDPNVNGRRLTVQQIREKIHANGGYVKGGGKAVFKPMPKRKHKIPRQVDAVAEDKIVTSDGIRHKIEQSGAQLVGEKASFKPIAKKKIVVKTASPATISQSVQSAGKNADMGKAVFKPLKKKPEKVQTTAEKGGFSTDDIRRKIEAKGNELNVSSLGKASFEPVKKKKQPKIKPPVEIKIAQKAITPEEIKRKIEMQAKNIASSGKASFGTIKKTIKKAPSVREKAIQKQLENQGKAVFTTLPKKK